MVLLEYHHKHSSPSKNYRYQIQVESMSKPMSKFNIEITRKLFIFSKNFSRLFMWLKMLKLNWSFV